MWQVQYTCSWVNYIMINWNHNEVSKRLWSHWKWSFFHRLLKVTKYSKSTTGLQSHTIRAWVLTSTVIDGKKTCAYRYPSLQVSWILNDRSCRLFIGRTRKGGVSKLHTVLQPLPLVQNMPRAHLWTQSVDHHTTHAPGTVRTASMPRSYFVYVHVVHIRKKTL